MNSCNACNAACPTTAPYCVSGVCRTHAPVTVDLRVEGNDADGTIFEGKVITSGRDLTTPTGGDGECDATYYNGNQVPMGTTTTALDDAARLNNFGWDGYYYGSRSCARHALMITAEVRSRSCLLRLDRS